MLKATFVCSHPVCLLGRTGFSGLLLVAHCNPSAGLSDNYHNKDLEHLCQTILCLFHNLGQQSRRAVMNANSKMFLQLSF